MIPRPLSIKTIKKPWDLQEMAPRFDLIYNLPIVVSPSPIRVEPPPVGHYIGNSIFLHTIHIYLYIEWKKGCQEKNCMFDFFS